MGLVFDSGSKLLSGAAINFVCSLASCDDEDLSGPAGGEEGLPVLVHPLRFGLGRTLLGHYAAAPVSNTVLIPCAVAALVWAWRRWWRCGCWGCGAPTGALPRVRRC